MKKTLLLVGALAILSTTVLGASTTIKELDSWVSGLHNVSVSQAQGSYKKTSSMIESAKKLGIEVIRDTPTGPTDMAKFGDGFKVNDKAQAEAFDKTVDAIAKNKEDIVTNKESIKNEISNLDGKIKDNTYIAQGNYNRHIGVANANGKKAVEMQKSVEKLGFENNFEPSKSSEPLLRNIESGKAQSDAFDKATQVIASNKKTSDKNEKDIANVGVMQEIHHETIFGTETEKGLINKVSENGDKITGNTGLILTVAEQTGKNIDAIEKNTQDLASHKSEALARDEKIEGAISDLKVTDGKVNTAIESLQETDKKLLATDTKLIQTDKDLKEADEKINSNIAILQKHDNAVYETVGVTRDGSGTEIKAVKADVNRAMINNLQRTVESDVATNTTNIEKNTAKTEENEENIKMNGRQIDQALELADHNSEYIEKNSKRIDSLEKKVDGLENKMNKGLAMAAATSSIVYPDLGKGDLGIGAGIGGYGNAQAIAIGVAMQPTENVRINTNVSTSDTSDTMYGAGVGYKFNIFGS